MNTALIIFNEIPIFAKIWIDLEGLISNEEKIQNCLTSYVDGKRDF